jgi:hypothetical protein
MSTTESQTVQRGYAVVTYEDGKVEEYRMKPSHFYEASKRVPTPDSQLQVTFMAAWLAAGKPRGGFEDWIDTVAKLDYRDSTDDVPPTNGATPSE